MAIVKTSSVIGILMMVLVGCSGQLGALTAAESNVTQDGSVLDAGAATDALSPNPCTAVALVAPTGGFAGQVGVAQPLSASATCPPGQTPEYQFWGKRSTDSNWTVLGSGYNAGSSSYTPVATDAGGYCYSVVVRAVGATENYQARSGATCGTIADGTVTPPPNTVTIAVPLFAPLAANVFPARSIPVGPLGVTVQLPAIPIGSTLVGAQARIKDGVGLSLFLAMSDQFDSNIVPMGTPSQPSPGSGVFQTLQMASLSTQTQSLHTYYAGVLVFGSSSGIGQVNDIEVTYVPPPTN